MNCCSLWVGPRLVRSRFDSRHPCLQSVSIPVDGISRPRRVVARVPDAAALGGRISDRGRRSSQLVDKPAHAESTSLHLIHSASGQGNASLAIPDVQPRTALTRARNCLASGLLIWGF